MAKLIMWNLISLDGFFEGAASWQLDWLHQAFEADPALQRHSLEQLRTADALIFGRVTYLGMAEAWQAREGEDAALMNQLPKIVFSRSLERTEWNNATLNRGDSVLATQGSEHRDVKWRDRLAQQLRVAVRADPIEDDPGEPHVRVEAGEPVDDRRDRARQSTGPSAH